jgi:hypothetical protein
MYDRGHSKAGRCARLASESAVSKRTWEAALQARITVVPYEWEKMLDGIEDAAQEAKEQRELTAPATKGPHGWRHSTMPLGPGGLAAALSFLRPAAE